MELALENLTKKYKDVTVVNQLNYVMANGVYGLLGSNGAGKTTLIRMICTLIKPDSGRILCNGKDIWQMDKAYRNLLGYLPQEFGFYPDFTAEEYLLYIASIKDLHPVLARKRMDELLRQVGMEKYRKKKMKRFSGGMKRRIGIAQAMLNNPKILVLDEPTAGLDPNERIRLRNLLS
ncbi:MAG: ATP-binding cassette domain-containing protein, partial [Lachnospiraceae bacterium]|nr:ATP-binding cassette domain-containing protein [Lachnospiraceae bacterium]